MLDDLKSLLRQIKDLVQQVEGLVARARQEEGLPPEPSQFPTARKPRIR